MGGRAAFSVRLPFISYQHSQGCFLGHLPSTPPPNAHHAALCPLSKANCPGRAVYPPTPFMLPQGMATEPLPTSGITTLSPHPAL